LASARKRAIWRARIARTRTSPCNPELERTRLNCFLPTRCNTSRNLSAPKDPLSRVRNSSLTFPPATSDASTCFQSRRSSNTFLRASGRRAADTSKPASVEIFASASQSITSGHVRKKSIPGPGGGIRVLAHLSLLAGSATRESAPELHRGQKVCTTAGMF
jgi:hypothetical protein